MASASAIALPSLLFNGSRTHLRNVPDVPVSTIPRGRKRCFAVVAKAAGDDSDSSSGSIVKSVQNADDRCRNFHCEDTICGTTLKTDLLLLGWDLQQLQHFGHLVVL